MEGTNNTNEIAVGVADLTETALQNFRRTDESVRRCISMLRSDGVRPILIADMLVHHISTVLKPENFEPAYLLEFHREAEAFLEKAIQELASVRDIFAEFNADFVDVSVHDL